MNNIIFDSVNCYNSATDGGRYLAPHFQVREFASKDGARAVFVHSLIPEICELVRQKNGAFSPNSAYRTVSHNAAVGGAANSWHIFGRAVDIPAIKMSAQEMYNYLCELYPDSMEIGVYSWGCHFGVTPNKSRFRG